MAYYTEGQQGVNDSDIKYSDASMFFPGKRVRGKAGKTLSPTSGGQPGTSPLASVSRKKSSFGKKRSRY